MLLAATTLLTSAEMYADTVASAGLRAAVGTADVNDRSIRVQLSSRVSDVATLDAAARARLQAVVDAGGGGAVSTFLSSESMAQASEPSSGTTLTFLATRPGIEDHATLSAGRWPAGGRSPVEAVLSAPAASALGASVGSQVSLLDRVHPGAPVSVVIVGTYLPKAGDDYWLEDPLDLQGTTVLGSFTTVGPIVVGQDDFLHVAPGDTVNEDWRAIPAVEALTAATLQPLADAATAFPDDLRAALPTGFVPRVQTNLPEILGRVDRSVLVGRSGVLVLVLEFAVVAAYAIVLVAGMLADRRRPETALIRTRGASGGHIAGIALAEAILLAGTAALVAPWISLAIVNALGTSGALTAARGSLNLSQAAILADVFAAVAGVVAMTLPNLGGIPSLSGVRAAISRRTNRTLGQRLGLDLALVVLAGVALWQLRLYGAPLTRNARGVLGIDPLLVAAPGICLLAGALLATRLLPRAAEIAEPLLARGRGLVGAIGGRGVARRPLRYTRSALLLMLAAALGTFATTYLATWTQSQHDQATYQAGADLRIESPSPNGQLTTGQVVGLPGTTTVVAAVRMSLDVGRSIRGATAMALDSALSMQAVSGLLPQNDSALRRLAQAPAAPEGLPVPDQAERIALPVKLGLKDVDSNSDADLANDPGLVVEVVIQNRFGEIDRFHSDAMPLAGPARLVELSIGGVSANHVGGLERRVISIDLVIKPTNAGTVASGTINLGEAQWTASVTGESGWTAISPPLTSALDWTGTAVDSNGSSTTTSIMPSVAAESVELQLGRPGPSAPNALAPANGAGPPVVIRADWTAPGASSPLPAIAGSAFLAATGARVGDSFQILLNRNPTDVSIVAVVDEFPTLDPANPFLIVDLPTFAAKRILPSRSLVSATEWWVSTAQPQAAADAAHGIEPDLALFIAPAIAAQLLNDPVASGLAGILRIGTGAALLVALIAYLFAIEIGASERRSEVALLRALGLGRLQALMWLAGESAVLLVATLVGGVFVGTATAAAVVPFGILTGAGRPPAPAPSLVVPAAGLTTLVVFGLAALTAASLVVGWHIRSVPTQIVLRGADE